MVKCIVAAFGSNSNLRHSSQYVLIQSYFARQKVNQMLSRTILLEMFKYNYDTNIRLLKLAKNITPVQWGEPQPAGQRSMHQTFFHLLVVEEEWVVLCEHGNPRWDYRLIENYSDVESLTRFADEAYGIMWRYIESVDEKTLASTVTGLMPDGKVHTEAIWFLLIHLLYHSAQHRSEIASMLTRYGFSPREIDFIGRNW